MVIKIGGEVIDEKAVDEWEQKRLAAAARVMEKKFHASMKDDCTLEDLAAAKRLVPDEEMRRKLKGNIRLTDLGTKFLNFICGKKRKSSVAEFELPGVTAKQVYDGVNDVMLENSKENLLLAVRANPDHYLLRGLGGQKQEVIECCGGLPFQSHFIITYGDDKELSSRQNPSCEYQAAGVCRLADGTAIGGVRHQFLDTPGGCHARCEVEFPAAMPKSILAEHQLHLACEFRNWFREILRRSGSSDSSGE